MLPFALLAVHLLASELTSDKLDLAGKVTYPSGRFRTLRVALFRVESPFTANTLTDPGGEFHFHNLPPGNYTLAVIRRGLGEIRRSVVLTSALADKKGVVRINIPFSPSDAALSRTAITVSKNTLTVPYKATLKYVEADRRLNKQDAKGAGKLLEQAVKIAPQYTAAWNFLGVLAYQGGEWDRAEEDFRHALQIERDSFEPNVNLGGVLMSHGDLQEALTLNQKAVELRPKDALANSQLGMTLYRLGRSDEALPYLESAEAADPSHITEPQLYISWIYEHRGDKPAAARELVDLLARHPDAPEADALRRRLRRLQNP
jgi:tetratricopeptide (TPR) repeat protein